MSDQLKLFISYASEDQKIAIAIFNTLQNAFSKDSISEIFLDTEAIRAGADIGEKIKDHLAKDDVLIVVSTGVSKPSHSWTGFEIGYFEASHKDQSMPAGIKGKVVAICLDGTAPSPTQNRKYVPLGISTALLDMTEQEFQNSLKIEDDDAFLAFLGDLYEATQGVKLRARQNKVDDFKRAALEFKMAVFLELKARVKQVRKPQKQFLVRYESAGVDKRRQDLPANAKMVSIGGAIEVFGVAQDRLTEVEITAAGGGLGPIPLPPFLRGKEIEWQHFREAVADHPLGKYWCDALAKVIIASATDNVDADNSQIIVSSDQRRLFRLVLTTSTTFYNNKVEVSLYLVDFFRRPDAGREDTTLLLKGLCIVCRFRFLFLENQSDFYHFTIRLLPAAQLPERCRQLLTELNLLQNDALQSGLAAPGKFLNFVDSRSLETMILAWRPIEVSIRSLCGQALQETGNEEALSRTVSALATQLQEIENTLAAHNATVIKGMAARLTELATGGQPKL